MIEGNILKRISNSGADDFLQKSAEMIEGKLIEIIWGRSIDLRINHIIILSKKITKECSSFADH
jgi:hypothetical protein